MLLVLFVLWIIFNGRFTWEIAAFGVVIAGAVYAFSCAFLGYNYKKEWRVLRKLPQILRYVWLLFREIVNSNLTLIRKVYEVDREVKPKLVTFKTPLKGALKSVLADCITVTPGTISVISEDDKLTVHCLDEDLADGIENTSFQQALLELAKEDEAC